MRSVSMHTFDDSGELLPKLLRWDLSGTTHSPMPFIEVKVVRAVAVKVFGEDAAESRFFLRLPAAVYGTAAVLLLYAIGGRLFGWATGFFGALLTSTEYVRGELGYVDGIEHAFGFPTGNMLSDRWASRAAGEGATRGVGADGGGVATCARSGAADIATMITATRITSSS